MVCGATPAAYADTSKKIKAVASVSRRRRLAKGMAGVSLSPHIPYGFKAAPNDRRKWVIDEEAAEVVRFIFRSFAEGKTIACIQRELEERQAYYPKAYKKFMGLENVKYDIPEDKKYKWSSCSVTFVLDNPLYIGTITNFKTYSKSFKSKKRHFRPESEWVTFENAVEPIIDMETWNVVRKLRQGKRRLTRLGDMGVLSGFVFCADCGPSVGCGAKMSLMRTAAKAGKDYYVCSTYRKNTSQCQSHNIRASVIETLVIEQLQEILTFVQNNEEEFVKIVSDNSHSEVTKLRRKLSKDISAVQKRVGELDKIIAKLYEDSVMGKITTEMFTKLSDIYSAEQNKLQADFTAYTEKYRELESKQASTDEFISTVKKYTEITELTTAILSEFVDRIIVHNVDKSSGERKQQIDILYNGIGMVNLNKNTGSEALE